MNYGITSSKVSNLTFGDVKLDVLTSCRYWNHKLNVTLKHVM